MLHAEVSPVLSPSSLSSAHGGRCLFCSGGGFDRQSCFSHLYPRLHSSIFHAWVTQVAQSCAAANGSGLSQPLLPTACAPCERKPMKPLPIDGPNRYWIYLHRTAMKEYFDRIAPIAIQNSRRSALSGQIKWPQSRLFLSGLT